MSRRPNNGLFTLGVTAEKFQLPHPRIELPVILLVRRVVTRAFEILRERGFDLKTAKEDEITAAIRGIIENDLRQSGIIAGFNRAMFETVTRQQQVENFDLTRLTKAPDLCFKLRNFEEEPRTLSTHDALFVECKPVDSNHSTGSDYCDKGLQRFVDGDYAWAMQDAVMVGYVRQNRTIPAHLNPVLGAADRRKQLKVLQLPEAVALNGASAAPELLRSRHARGFPWVYEKGPASDLSVYHWWYDCG